MVETMWFGSVDTLHGKLLVSAEAVNDAGTELALRVQVQPSGFSPGFEFVKSTVRLAGGLMEGDMEHGGR